MLDTLLAPFQSPLVHNALIGGLIIAAVSALLGPWIIVRGLTFLGESISHGMVPGIAVAYLLQLPAALGGAISALVMAGIISSVKHRRITGNTAIALLLVGSLALGVIVISRSATFTVDISTILFGDILAVRGADIGPLLLIAAAAGGTILIARRALTVLTIDPRTAGIRGFRPALTSALLIGLVAVTAAASFQIVGTLLFFGLLIAPAAAMLPWAGSMLQVTVGAGVIGMASVVVGIWLSYHLGTAAGASIVMVAVATFFVSLTAEAWARRLGRARTAATPLPVAAPAPRPESLSPAPTWISLPGAQLPGAQHPGAQHPGGHEPRDLPAQPAP